MLEGYGKSYGAITILNAILTGKGVTASVSLSSEVRVKIEMSPGKLLSYMNGFPYESKLVQKSASLALNFAGERDSDFSGKIFVQSNIPVGVGLKSSSSVSTATIIAVFDALNFRDFSPMDVITLSAKASILSGVSITGAHDDAASCVLGGVNFTDNRNGKLILSRKVKPLDVVACIPEEKSKRKKLLKRRSKNYRYIVSAILKLAELDRFWDAMSLNGMLYSSIMGYFNRIPFDAIKSGALGSGLSGTGPSVVSVFNDSELSYEFAKKYIKKGLYVITTRLNNRCSLKL
jgi:shikimate kinase